MIDVASQLFESYLEALEESHVYILPQSDEEASIIQGAISGDRSLYLKISEMHELAGNEAGSSHWAKLHLESGINQSVHDSSSRHIESIPSNSGFENENLNSTNN